MSWSWKIKIWLKKISKLSKNQLNSYSAIFRQLEEGLEMMGSEFESMENYWQKKMNDERQLYESQLKMNEVQFKDLEVKMKEYEDMLMTIEPKHQIEADGLSTIDEKRDLEEQVCMMYDYKFCYFYLLLCRSMFGRKKSTN